MACQVTRMRYLLRLTIVAGIVFSTLSALAESPAKDSPQYVRLRRGEKSEPLALETAVVALTAVEPSRRGVQVDLIGAIHIGDRQYYEQLNERFKRYDAVLYELVAREDANVPVPGKGRGNFISGMQVGLKSLLGLEYQLDCVNYRVKNMVHADMSPEEFAETMKKRKESFTGMFFRMLGAGVSKQAHDPLGTSDWRLLAAVFAEDRGYQLKLAMAEQFADLGGEMDVFDGPDGSTIVTERNKKALEVLTRELGKGKKRIAIFYGAAHLADLQRKLNADFGMQPAQTEWVPAWSLVRAARPDAPAKKPASGQP